MSAAHNAEALELKEKGNQCVREGKYEEAVLHYTQAIKLEPANYSLYSNRSLAFLKLQHYYLSHEDACEAIRLKPEWPKGYYRKGEVLSATYQFSEALLSYKIAQGLLPHDCVIKEAVQRTTLQLYKDKRADQQIPWVGAGVGIIIGVLIVISDQVFTAKPSITHPMLMALVAMTVALVGFAGAKSFRYYTWCQRKGLLDAPLDLLEELRKKNNGSNVNNSESGKSPDRTQRHTTKAQARMKLRKSRV